MQAQFNNMQGQFDHMQMSANGGTMMSAASSNPYTIDPNGGTM